MTEQSQAIRQSVRQRCERYGLDRDQTMRCVASALTAYRNGNSSAVAIANGWDVASRLSGETVREIPSHPISAA